MSILGLASLHANVSPNKSFFILSPGPKSCIGHTTFSRAGTTLWRYVSVTLFMSSSGMLLHLHQCVWTKGSSRPLHKGTSASLFISEIIYLLDVQICAYWDSQKSTGYPSKVNVDMFLNQVYMLRICGFPK